MAYLMAVEGEPEPAVAEAVRKFIRGEVKRDRHTFLPTTAELAIEVRARAEMIAVRARAAQRVLARPAIAAPVSPVIRASVSKMMRDLADTLHRGKPDIGIDLAKGSDTTAWIEIDTKPVRASRSLIATLGLAQSTEEKE